MTATGEANKTSVIKIVQELLAGEPDKAGITPALIAQKIGLVLMMNPKWSEELDANAVTDELIRRFSIWRGEDSSLENNVGHVKWLSAEKKTGWRYWQRYREMQEQRLPWDAVEGLDKSTDKILGMLEDPARPGPWDRRGLVVGHVQSGKTGNYTGLICKAADAGYKIIIVLAGMHNNLRSQTQMRLDEGFLGFETNPLAEAMRVTGVGTIDSDPAIRPNHATNRTEKGDFITSNIRHLGVSPEQLPWLFVIKKNKTVLTRLLRWISERVTDGVDPVTGRRIARNRPLLIIDDEADHASVDTGNLYDEDGNLNEDHQPTAINSLIRQILHSFHRKAYVGYTATPFANIFIHERGETEKEGPDLFPAAFIHNLGAPSNYIGPARVFGLSSGDQREGSLPLIREVDDHCSADGKSGWMPVSHKSGYIPEAEGPSGMPRSLCDAVDSFLLACAIRHLRGQKDEHASMLVHVTRFNAVQRHVHSQVEAYVRQTDQRLARSVGHEAVLMRLHSLWEQDFVVTSASMTQSVPDAGPFAAADWDAIAAILPEVVAAVSVRMINGTAGDVLDYADSPAGLKIIAIGGDKLARGLTLEGLCTSYFLRASRMYDTLMQMGRWFGYRPGYLDLCRLYTTGDLIEWFEHIADASEELREEFEMMVESHGTPRDYGLKVVSHPVLMVTSRLKMRSAKSLYLSFSGHVVETVTFHRDQQIVGANFAALERLVAQLGAHRDIPERKRAGNPERWKGRYWEDVGHADVTDFLTAYRTHPEALRVNSSMLREFISTMAASGELTTWTVALVGGSVDGDCKRFDGSLTDVARSHRKVRSHGTDRYSIGRLLNSKDDGIDLDDTAWLAALAETRELWAKEPARPDKRSEPEVPSGAAMRRVRGFGAEGVPARPERGVLLIFLLDPPHEDQVRFPADSPALVGFGISFPGSTTGTKVEYKVNNVLWEQEYGAAD